MKLVLNALRKSYGEHCALDGVTLEIDSTKCLALIGPSGGGKSTLLRIIAGLEAPTSGTIELNRHAMPDTEDALRAYRRTIGTVFQSYNLFPHLDALANIALPLTKVHGLSLANATARASQLLDRFALATHSRKRPAELSGGQNQRIAIARAIAHDPELILFDEPTSALDPEMTAEVLDIVEELIHDGKECVIVTHQMGFAKRVSEHVVLLSQGQVGEYGKSESVFATPKNAATKSFLESVLRY